MLLLIGIRIQFIAEYTNVARFHAFVVDIYVLYIESF